MNKSVLCLIGTRPEAIKMAPVILALRQHQWLQVRVCATAQHRELLDEALAIFGIAKDIDLNVMTPNQSLSSLTARLVSGIDQVLANEQPDIVLAQGDTTTVLSAALACFYQRIPFGHIEAGLRTGDKHNPFPEEMNRVLTGHLSTLHFAPTERAKNSLLSEGFAADSIYVTGNTVIDSLLHIANTKPTHGLSLPKDKRLVLLTAHRRENFGNPLREVFRAMQTLTQHNPNIHVIYPVHPNPNVREPAIATLAHNKNITLCSPLDYRQLVALLSSVDFVITDSGGIQEEAPALCKPVLVLREETERPEAIEAGVAMLVGTRHDDIVNAAERLLTDAETRRRMSSGGSPYGDGHAAVRIVEAFGRFMTFS